MPGEVAKTEIGEAGPLRDQEGLVFGLYRHLWLKNSKGETCDVNIPHTVIFQNQEPVAWYFTSLKENKVMRKKKPSQGPVLADAFMAGRESQPEVCAWFTGNMTTTESNVLKTRNRPRDHLAEDEVEVVLQARAMEHLPYDKVQTMLDPGPYRLVSEEHVYDGLMQKFLEPRNPNDFIIRAIWSPSACIFEKRTNKHRLLPRPDLGPHQEIPPLVDRIASFNSSMWLHEHMPISTKALKTRLLAQCDSVAHHIKEVTHGQTVVKRMELFFKIDTHHRIWLLFCNSLSVERCAPDDPRYPRISQQGEAAQGPASFVLKDPTQPKEELANEEEQGSCLCAMTGKIFPRSQRIHVTYKLIMQHWFKRCAELSSESDRIAALDSIPPAIRRANPNMSREFYLRCRSQPFFLLNIADVSPDADEDLLRAAYDDLAESLGHPLGLGTSLRAKRPKAAASKPPPPDPGARDRPRSHGLAVTAPLSSSWPGQGLEPSSSRGHPGMPSALLPRGEKAKQGTWSASHSSTRSAWTSWQSQQLPSPLYRQPPPPTSTAKRPLSRPVSALDQDSESSYSYSLPAYASRPQQRHQQQRPPPRPAQAPRPATALGTIAEEASMRLARTSDLRRSFLRANYIDVAAAAAAAAPPPRPAPQQQRYPASAAAGPALCFDASGEPEPYGGLGDARGTASTGGGSTRSDSQSQSNAYEQKTLKEISDAYLQAELLTQQLLSQAHQLLRSPSDSVQGGPGAAAASPPPPPQRSDAPAAPMGRSPLRAPTPPEEDGLSDWTVSLTGSRRSSVDALPIASVHTSPGAQAVASPDSSPCSTPRATAVPSEPASPYGSPGGQTTLSFLTSPYTSPGGQTVASHPTSCCTSPGGQAIPSTCYTSPGGQAIPSTCYTTPGGQTVPSTCYTSPGGQTIASNLTSPYTSPGGRLPPPPRPSHKSSPVLSD